MVVELARLNSGRALDHGALLPDLDCTANERSKSARSGGSKPRTVSSSPCAASIVSQIEIALYEQLPDVEPGGVEAKGVQAGVRRRLPVAVAEVDERASSAW